MKNERKKQNKASPIHLEACGCGPFSKEKLTLMNLWGYMRLSQPAINNECITCQISYWKKPHYPVGEEKRHIDVYMMNSQNLSYYPCLDLFAYINGVLKR